MENTQKQSEKQSEWKNRELGALFWVRSGKGQNIYLELLMLKLCLG